jgi:hypothetical protein
MWINLHHGPAGGLPRPRTPGKLGPVTRAALLALCIAAAALAPTAAHAGGEADRWRIRPYVGVDYQHTANRLEDRLYLGPVGVGDADVWLDGDKLYDDDLDGINVHAGLRLHRNFGVEAAYYHNFESDKSLPAGETVSTLPGHTTQTLSPIDTSFESKGVTLEGMGYLPLGDRERFELIGSAGLSWTEIDVHTKFPEDGIDIHDTEDAIGFLFGAGGQGYVTEHVNLRGMVRYQVVDFEEIGIMEDFMDGAWIFSFGANYVF